MTPGHSQFALQPGTQWWPTQMRPEPSFPGLQSPSLWQEVPPLELELPLLLPLELPLLDPPLDPLLEPELPPLLDPPPHGSSTM